MKAGASILVSFVVGALVTLVLMGWGSEGEAAQVVASPPRHIAEPRLEQRKPTVRQAPLPTTALINIPRLDLKAS